MIEHDGLIEQINGNHITVRILQQSACSSCNAKGYCTAADSSEKTVEITDYTGKFALHERVKIEGNETMGYKAVWWAYVLPLLIVVAVVIFSSSLWNLSEIQGAFVAILSLVPYYIILFMLKDKMAKKFTFTITKADPTNSLTS